MTRLAFAILLVAAACSSRGSRGPGATSGTDATAPDTEELALRYERGDGVPRDYTRAIRIYETLCAGGDGDLVACRRMVANHTEHRGQLRDPRIDPFGLLTRACRGGDWLSCGLYVPFDEAAAQAACDGDQPAACLAINSTHYMSQSGTVESEDDDRRKRACDGGVIEACLEIVTHANNADEAAPPEVVTVVGRECDRGDADACEVLGKAIDPAELCRADDFEACAEVGQNDAAALEKACEHEIVESCETIALRARDADPPDPRVADYFERACRLGSDVACRQNKPKDLAIGCAAYQPTRVPDTQRRQLPRLGGTVAGVKWSAPKDRPFVVQRYDERNGEPTLYGEIARRLGDDTGVYVLVDSSADPAEFAPAIALVLDPNLADERLTAATKHSVGSALGLRLRNGWPTIVDVFDTPRAILSTEWGIHPGTLARCARGILAEP